jgi:hypothetical protein
LARSASALIVALRSSGVSANIWARHSEKVMVSFGMGVSP